MISGQQWEMVKHQRRWSGLISGVIQKNPHVTLANSLFSRSRHCVAVCDVPSILHWEKIHEAFPSAKIILTSRDPAQWYRSINTTLTPLAQMVNRWSWMMKVMCFVFYQRTSQIELLKLLLDQFTRVELLEEDTATKLVSVGNQNYTTYIYFSRFIKDWNDEIVQKCNNNVLTFNVADGWEPLCQYLDCSVPQSPFPRYFNCRTSIIDWLIRD